MQRHGRYRDSSDTLDRRWRRESRSTRDNNTSKQPQQHTTNQPHTPTSSRSREHAEFAHSTRRARCHTGRSIRYLHVASYEPDRPRIPLHQIICTDLTPPAHPTHGVIHFRVRSIATSHIRNDTILACLLAWLCDFVVLGESGRRFFHFLFPLLAATTRRDSLSRSIQRCDNHRNSCRPFASYVS